MDFSFLFFCFFCYCSCFMYVYHNDKVCCKMCRYFIINQLVSPWTLWSKFFYTRQYWISCVHNGFVLFRFPLPLTAKNWLFINVYNMYKLHYHNNLCVSFWIHNLGHPSVYPFCAPCFLRRHVCTTRNEKQDIPHNILVGNGNIIRILVIHDCDVVDGRSKTNHHSQ